MIVGCAYKRGYNQLFQYYTINVFERYQHFQNGGNPYLTRCALIYSKKE